MNIDDPNERETERPKFDDVASLFGRIVPPAGTPVRPGPLPRKLPTPSEPIGPAILVTPPILTTAKLAPVSSAPVSSARVSSAPPKPTPPTLTPPPLGPVALSPDAPASLPQAEPALPTVERTAPRPLPSRTDDRAARVAFLDPDPARKPKSKAANAPNVPWPDAFEPQPNYRRKPASPNWAWLLLVPLLAIVAIGVFTLNPRMIRSFVDSYFPHLQSPTIGTVTSLLPAPFRTDGPAANDQPKPQANATPTTPKPDAPAPIVPVPPPSAETAPTQPSPPEPATTEPAPPQASAPVAVPAPTEQPPEPPPPQAASPLAPPTPSSNETTQAQPAPAAESPASPEPVIPPAPAPTSSAVVPLPLPVPPQPPASAPSTPPSAIQPAIAHVIVHYRRIQPAGEAEARRVAAQAERLASGVELRPGASSYRSPTVVYYTPLDRDAATALARSLGESWAVRAGPGRAVAGTIDLWLP